MDMTDTPSTPELARAYGSGYRRALNDAQKAIEQRYRELRPTSQDWPLIVMDDLIDDATPYDMTKLEKPMNEGPTA